MTRPQGYQTFNYLSPYDRINSNTNVCRRWLLLDISPRRRRPFRSLCHLRHSKNARQISVAEDTSRTQSYETHHNHDNARNAEPELVPVRFEFTHPTATTVCVAGTFNHWQPEAKTLHPAGGGRWVKKACPTRLAEETRF